jgi:hypothetical protein
MASTVTVINDVTHAEQEGIVSVAWDAALDGDVPLQLLLAVGSRESGLGRRLASTCIHPGGEHGLWGIHPRWYGPFTSRTDPCDHAAYARKAAEILGAGYRRFGNWKDALAAYNAGPDDVERARRQGVDPDRYTTGGNYGADVLWRARVIREALPMQLPEVVVEGRRPSRSVALPLALLGIGAVGLALYANREE